jgi:hypothetical protein
MYKLRMARGAAMTLLAALMLGGCMQATLAPTPEEHIGRAISSGCIRLTNEDVIDLFNRVKVGTTVVVLGPTNYLSSGPRGVDGPNA